MKDAQYINFQLLAWEKGISIVWKTSGFLNSDSFKETLNIPLNEKVTALLLIGFPEEIPAPKKRTSVSEKLQIIKGMA